MKKIVYCLSIISFFLGIACSDKKSTEIDSATPGDGDTLIQDEDLQQPDMSDTLISDESATDSTDELLPDNDEDTAISCTVVTIKKVSGNAYEDSIEYYGIVAESLGSADTSDTVAFFFRSADENLRTTLVKGSYTLGEGVNKKASTCTECIFVMEDYDEESGKTGKAYFAESGVFEVTNVAENGVDAEGVLTAKMIQVYLDLASQEAVPVPGGSCLEFKAAPWTTACTPDCEGRVCGSDGCGGVCGDGCPEGTQCNTEGTDCIACTSFTVNDFVPVDEWPGQYRAELTANIDGKAGGDALYIDLFNGQELGTYNLAEGDNAFYSSCKQCVNLHSDLDSDGGGKSYFQQSGTLTITDLLNDNYGVMGAHSAGHIDSVRVVEMEVIEENGEYKNLPVPGGACYEITTASWDTMPTE